MCIYVWLKYRRSGCTLSILLFRLTPFLYSWHYMGCLILNNKIYTLNIFMYCIMFLFIWLKAWFRSFSTLVLFLFTLYLTLSNIRVILFFIHLLNKNVLHRVYNITLDDLNLESWSGSCLSKSSSSDKDADDDWSSLFIIKFKQSWWFVVLVLLKYAFRSHNSFTIFVHMKIFLDLVCVT